MPQLDESEIRAFLTNDYARVVNAVAFGSLGFADAEDAVQEALMKAWVHAEKGHPIDRLDSWVTVAAWNHSRSRLRHVGAERRARARLASITLADRTDEPDDAIDIGRALATLPRRLREVVVLRYVLRLSTAETSDALGIAEGTVKRSLSDARAALGGILRVRDDEEVTDVSDR